MTAKKAPALKVEKTDEQKIAAFSKELEALLAKYNLGIQLGMRVAPANVEQTTFGMQPTLNFVTQQQ